MKGIAGRTKRGLPTGATLTCIDNTGAKIVEIVSTPKLKGTHRRYPRAGIGDLVVISVKKGTVDLRRQLLKAIVVRQKRPFRRPDGTMIQFEDNAAVIITETGDLKGSMIKGPVAIEAAERWPRVGATASIIV
ncbi:MAG: 50S ribosomal protein L14 [Candidatus Thermoplasmatota archaeon]